VEDIIASLQRDEGDEEIYALANSVGAATVAQLKLDLSPKSDATTGSTLEAECQRARAAGKSGQGATLNSLRIVFFLHIYHENQEAGGVKSLLYLREAITLAQIMGIHRESAYDSLPTSEQEIRRRILWLLFVTERGVAMLHNLPVILKCNVHFPSTEGDDGSHILPAFLKLINLFWIFDQSGAFDILQDSSSGALNFSTTNSHQSSLEIVQKRLQDVPIDWESSNDVQRADICVTRQWMRAVLWRAAQDGGSYSNQPTSLSHPIQIAKEFLAVISKLPTTAIEAHGPSIEFKIYEIASAVADAMTNSVRVWDASTNAREVLRQLHRILASCRGGNVTLASMLYLKMVQIQDQQQLLLELSPRIEELGDQWTSQMINAISFPCGFERLSRPGTLSPSLPRSVEDQRSDGVGLVNARRIVERADLRLDGETPFPEAEAFPWVIGNGQELASAFTGSTDLYEQLQNFDSSFSDFELSDVMDPLLSADSDILQRIAGHGFPNMLSPNSAVSL